MKTTLFSLILATAMTGSFAQGAPSPVGQSISPEAAASAEKAVDARHAKRVAKKAAKAAKKASATGM